VFNLRPLLDVIVELRHGTVVGVAAPDGSLAAFGWNLPLPETLEPYVFAQLGHTESGYVCTSAVVPAHRGRRLQRVVAGALLDELVAAGHRWAAITVSPTNTASLRNLRACGFMQVGRGPVYGDHERLVLMKELA
jgi:ribosomal protein S18 acetylase RimI-like enzyme